MKLSNCAIFLNSFFCEPWKPGMRQILVTSCSQLDVTFSRCFLNPWENWWCNNIYIPLTPLHHCDFWQTTTRYVWHVRFTAMLIMTKNVLEQAKNYSKLSIIIWIDYTDCFIFTLISFLWYQLDRSKHKFLSFFVQKLKSHQTFVTQTPLSWYPFCSAFNFNFSY